MKDERTDGIFYFPPAYEGLVFAGFGFVVSTTGRFLDYGDISGVVGAFVAATTTCVRLLWPLRTKIWFWVVIAALVIVQALVVVNFPFDPEEFRPRSYAFFALLDIVVIMSVVVSLHKLGSLLNRRITNLR